MTITIDGIPVSGSTGATTYARNRSGAYQRRRVKPVNPNSTRQQSVRNSFIAAVNAWINLSALERSGWDTYADQTPWFNRAGQSIRMTGQNAYIRVYVWDDQNGLTPPVLAPGLFTTGAIDLALGIATYDVSANTINISVDAPTVANSFQVEDGRLQFLVSAPSNPSRNFHPGLFQRIGKATIGAVPASPVTSGAKPSPYVYQAGQLIWVKCRGCTPDFILSPEVLLGPIVVTIVP